MQQPYKQATPLEIYNALDLKKGAKVDTNRMGGTLTQPIQFLSRDEKTPEWSANVMDWLEFQGLKQIRRNARRLMKNYKLAKGIIDKTDYIVEPDNEMRDLVGTLMRDEVAALELKFYPIIPNVINTLCAEFAKRTTSVTFRSVDDYSYNELLEQKRGQIEKVLFADAQQDIIQGMIEQGLDPEDPKVQEQMQQQLSQESLKTLPEIEGFFKKNYRSLVEEWAMHQHKVDVERFKMDELEERGFRNMLITDREFWHFKMLEDDYDIELWNPVLTFYHKSPECRYISQGNWVGKTEMLTVSDVIDKYGYMMTLEQMRSIEAIYPIRSAGYPIQGYQNDGHYYDGTKSHDWNTHMPSLAFRQFMSMYENSHQGGDVVNYIVGESEDFVDAGTTFLLRCTTTYWKSQRMVGHLTRIKENGEVVTDVVDEDYKITDKPIYNNTLIKNKTKDTLIFGEHIEWIWINQVYGGVKIGPNHPSFWGMNSSGGINPIYLGINQNAIGPLKFQFKGDNSLYGCKLPVEGAVFSDYNTRSTALVDLMKPCQIGYNIALNQLSDLQIDELGSIVVFDQNSLPKHSLGEDWGKANYAKAFTVMKNFQMMPLDRGLDNMGGANGNQPLQQLNLEQTNRMMSRIQIATYMKQEAFGVIGITPQRMGQQMGRETAKGVEENLNASYAQTEIYFIQHADYLMPRVHQMRTDLAQYYQSTKPSIRLQYITSADEKVNFQMNGTDLLLKDLNIFCTTKANHRALLEDLKALSLSNNTAGASIFDLAGIMQADSLAEVTHVMKDIEEKADKQRQEQMQHEQEMKNAEIEASIKERQMMLDHAELEAEKNRRRDLLVAEIRAAGYGAGVDKDANNQNDFLDFMDRAQKTTEFQETMNFEQSKEQNKQLLNEDKQNIQREKMRTQMAMKEIDLQIARENKQKFEVKPKEKKKT